MFSKDLNRRHVKTRACLGKAYCIIEGKYLNWGCFKENYTFPPMVICSVLKICLYIQGYLVIEIISFTFQGDTLASCDSYGTVKLWDVRQGAPMVSFDVGPHPANRVAFDPTGKIFNLRTNISGIRLSWHMTSGRPHFCDVVDHFENIQAKDKLAYRNVYCGCLPRKQVQQ